MASLTFGRVGNCLILVHPEKPPTDAEWDSYLAFLEENRGDRVRLLVSTQGGGPSAQQRTRLRTVIDRYPGKKLTTAILTESMVARGMVTAISWFMPGLQAFSPNQMPSALDYLGIPRALETEITRTILQLRRSLAG
jgi:hypothetical protein